MSAAEETSEHGRGTKGSFPPDHLEYLAHINMNAFFGFLVYSGKSAAAAEDYKYWGGAVMPWRHGTSDEPVTDSAVVAREEEHKAAAEAEDEANGENAERLRGR
eukprot:CAMPEP_0172618484 /NCGR_PEP_ID=MMETSP1068-20121228/81576_1 /TAXON_ID=35684 /ORGANISM="Pseudopedinella elastica, Strain CCMP716" /LENGTH=103 /DNA_ID=CAMNT_0013424745 /DNA_START=170 /DNA_END=478 /DNA_ORIENTATION=+